MSNPSKKKHCKICRGSKYDRNGKPCWQCCEVNKTPSLPWFYQWPMPKNKPPKGCM